MFHIECQCLYIQVFSKYLHHCLVVSFTVSKINKIGEKHYEVGVKLLVLVVRFPSKTVVDRRFSDSFCWLTRASLFVYL